MLENYVWNFYVKRRRRRYFTLCLDIYFSVFFFSIQEIGYSSTHLVHDPNEINIDNIDRDKNTEFKDPNEIDLDDFPIKSEENPSNLAKRVQLVLPSPISDPNEIDIDF